jgi:hypothetical protein
VLSDLPSPIGQKKQSHVNDPASVLGYYRYLTGHIDAEIASQPAFVLALEIFVSGIFVTCFSFLFSFDVIMFPVCKFHISPLIGLTAFLFLFKLRPSIFSYHETNLCNTGGIMAC